MNRLSLLLFVLAVLSACQNDQKLYDSQIRISFQEIPAPVQEGGEPDLFVTDDGQVLLSWIEYLNDSTDALMFSKLEQDRWGSPLEIARGNDWFVNWADFPSVATFKGYPDHLVAHWLQKSDKGTFDYDVRIAQSKDGGKSWSASFIPHTDGIAAEHGFATLLPLDNGHIFATWLDGRNTKGEKAHNDSHADPHAHTGAMTLRTAEFDIENKLFQEAELDERVCDCCQTDAALTSSGPVVIYRDRSDEEIRDISIVRKVNSQWTKPRPVFNDNWKIAGCPVNGPAIAARDQKVVVTWFTAADSKGQVKAAFSSDGGETFSSPIQIDDGNPMGRVDVVLLDNDTALISWIENTEAAAEIRLAKANVNGKISKSIPATNITASRQSGFPILEKVGDQILLAWTNVDSVTNIKTMFISL